MDEYDIYTLQLEESGLIILYLQMLNINSNLQEKLWYVHLINTHTFCLVTLQD